jgi:nicotinamide mononucleotide transporter
MQFFSVQTIAFSIGNYSLSWLEFIGTIFNLWSVWLMTRNRILSWPIGIIGVILFLMLFWQIRLYADFFEQIYYIATGFWGWWLWQKSGAPDEGKIHRNTLRENISWIAGIAALSIVAGWANSNLNVWLPKFFPEAASFAYLDAATTIMSFGAQILMARRRLECWPIWIAVDFIGVWLYWQKGVVFVSGLYVVFLVMAVLGLLSWRRQAQAGSTPGAT